MSDIDKNPVNKMLIDDYLPFGIYGSLEEGEISSNENENDMRLMRKCINVIRKIDPDVVSELKLDEEKNPDELFNKLNSVCVDGTCFELSDDEILLCIDSIEVGELVMNDKYSIEPNGENIVFKNASNETVWEFNHEMLEIEYE